MSKKTVFLTETSYDRKGYKGVGWYIWDYIKDEAFGPFNTESDAIARWSTVPNNSISLPITNEGPERRWQYCRCAMCKLVGQCTPDTDYYTTKYAVDPTALLCENCFRTITGLPNS